MKMNKGLWILIFFWGTAVFAQEDIKLSGPFLSLKYSRGAFLVYDCKDAHWVCTGVLEFKACSRLREFELFEKFGNLSCVPISEFSGEKDCIESQSALITNAFGMRHCKHPEQNLKGNGH